MINYCLKAKQQGFTLIELMIALLVGLFLTGTVVEVFLSTSKTNKIQDNLSRMQENARFAMHSLSRNIRQSAYFGGNCVEGVMGSVTNHINTASAQYNPLEHQFNLSTLENPIEGVNGVVNAGNSALDLPDSITIKSFPSGASLPLTANMANTADVITIDQAGGVEQNDIVLVTDCRMGDIFQVTNINVVAGNDQLQHSNISPAAGDGPGNTDTTLQQVYNTSAHVYRMVATELIKTYSIEIDAQGVPGLNNGQQLVANIENMQILYGRVLSGGADTHYVSADLLTPIQMEDVQSVRISLLVRSPDDNIVDIPQTYTFNGSLFTAEDRRLRKVYTTTIALRNRRN